MKRVKISLIAAVVLVALALTLVIRQRKPEALLPDALLAYTATQDYAEEEAAELINQLHMTQVKGVASAVTVYADTAGHEARAYAMTFDDDKTAEETLAAMVLKLAKPGRHPFAHFRELRRHGRQVFSVLGLGKLHFLFRDARTIYWLSTDMMAGDRLLSAFVQFMNSVQ